MHWLTSFDDGIKMIRLGLNRASDYSHDTVIRLRRTMNTLRCCMLSDNVVRLRTPCHLRLIFPFGIERLPRYYPFQNDRESLRGEYGDLPRHFWSGDTMHSASSVARPEPTNNLSQQKAPQSPHAPLQKSKLQTA